MRRTWGSRPLWSAALCVVLASPWDAAAQPDDAAKNAARELAEQAAQAVEKGDDATAQDLYRRAYALVPAPTIAVRQARSLARLGRWVEALEAYVRTTRFTVNNDSPVAFRDAVQQGYAELAALRQRMPRLEVKLKGVEARSPGLKLSIDGKPYAVALVGVASPVDPGAHQLELTTADGRHATAEVNLAEKESKSVELAVTALPGQPAESEAAAPEPKVVPHEPDKAASPPSSQRTWALLSLGVGVVGVGVGVTTGLMATSKHSSAESSCPNNKCVEGSSGASDVDSFRSLRTVSTVGYVIGAIGLGAGVTLWLTAPKPAEKTAKVGVWLGPRSAGIRGAF